MSYVDSIVSFAEGEEGVYWARNPDRILEYFKSATGRAYTKEQALTISWCTYFVMWVLEQSKLDPMPAVGEAPPRNFATGRFIASIDGHNATNKMGDHLHWGVYDAHTVQSKKYTPKAGDLFYLPSFNDHIGIVTEVLSGAKVMTLNGNSGPKKGEGFDHRFVNPRHLGGSFVYRRMRDLGDGTADHAGAIWIEIPD